MNRLHNFKTPGKSGYILLPRTLLNSLICENQVQMSETQAYTTMLTLANFKEVQTRSSYCRRGESLMPLLQWKRIFGWSESKTRRFFNTLENNNIISVNREKLPHIISLLHYEELCGNKKTVKGSAPKNLNDEMFDKFWEHYHLITQIPAHDIELARHEWNKLNQREKGMALNNVDEYFMALENVRHVRKAVNYLKNKTFIL